MKKNIQIIAKKCILHICIFIYVIVYITTTIRIFYHHGIILSRSVSECMLFSNTETFINIFIKKSEIMSYRVAEFS